MPPHSAHINVAQPSSTHGQHVQATLAAASAHLRLDNSMFNATKLTASTSSVTLPVRANRYIAEPVCYDIREQRIHARVRSYSASSASDSSDTEDQDMGDDQTHAKYVMYGVKITRPGDSLDVPSMAHAPRHSTLPSTPKTIFRRYQDFEELNDMLPADVSNYARLPGRRWWSRLRGARFSPESIQQRHTEVVSYLQRVIDMVPEFDAVQMFICDDWLSRDTPKRARQFRLVRLQKRKIERLLSEHDADAHRFLVYIRPNEAGAIRQRNLDKDGILLERPCGKPAKREHTPSPLGLAQDTKHQHTSRRGTAQHSNERNTAGDPPSTTLNRPRPACPAARRLQLLMFAPEHTRVRALKASDDSTEGDVVAHSHSTQSAAGTPGLLTGLPLPRAPVHHVTYGKRLMAW